jgi:hypothetical protein
MWEVQETGKRVVIVANRNHPDLDLYDIPFLIRENTGLEFGAYDTFLKKIWDGGDILFCHDDIEFSAGVCRDFQVFPGWKIMMHNVMTFTCDAAFIFTGRGDDVKNCGMHGRMFYVSASLARKLLDDGGMWFDEKNTGFTTSERPEGVAHYNEAITRFRDQVKRLGVEPDIVYMPFVKMAKRGEFENEQHTQQDTVLLSGGETDPVSGLCDRGDNPGDHDRAAL